MISSARRIAEQTPTVDVAELIAELRAINEYGRVSNMLRSTSVRPSFLRSIWQAMWRPADDGRLTPAQHDLIGRYVAAQIHASPVAEAIQAKETSESERLLLEFVGELIQQPYLIADAQIRRLHDAGWTDTQIAEAVYDANLYHLMARIDDAFSSLGPVPSTRVGAFAA